MNTYEEMEYSNVALQFNHLQIQCLVEALLEAGLPVAWRETRKFFILSIKTEWTTQRLTFDKLGKMYKLRNKNYQVRDQRLASVLQRFIQEVKGHAILKYLSSDQLVVQNIRYGEPVRIIQIRGAQKKILFEKECIVTMEQVLDAFKRTDAEERIPVLKLEIDYELALLYDAMKANDLPQVSASKEKLEVLRLEMLMLEI